MNKKKLKEKNGYKLFAVAITEGSKQRVGVMFYQVNKAGEMSVPTIIQRVDLLKKSKALQELLNLGICLTEEELDEVIEKAKALLESADQADDIDTRSTPSQLHKAICEHGKEVTSELILNKEDEEPKWMVWLDKDYLNIRTSDFNDFIKGIPEADEFKRADILRSLKLMGVLDTDVGRAYDKKVSKNNQKLNCYRIALPASKSKKVKSAESIPIEVVEETKPVETKAESIVVDQIEAEQITIEEVLQEQDKAVKTPAEQIKKAILEESPIIEKEKLLAGLKEILTAEAEVKLEPVITEKPNPESGQNDLGGFLL